MSKITDLTAASTVDLTNDELVLVDVSDTSMAGTGTTKKCAPSLILSSLTALQFASSTRLLPNGDGGLIVEQADGTDTLTLSSGGVLSTASIAGTTAMTLGSGRVQFANADGALSLGSDIAMAWRSTTTGGTRDTFLHRDGAANSLALRNSTNAQSFSVYKTYTDASNYERLRTYWNNNTATIVSEAAGTGAARNIQLTAGSSGLGLATNGGVSFTGSSFQLGSLLNIATSSNVTYFRDSSFSIYRDLASGGTILKEKSADPANPAEGFCHIWQSDGTGSGDDGDIMVKITAGGTTKTITLVDFSAF